MGISLRKKIDEMCKYCIYDDGGKAGGTWRQQVEGCTSPKCPLFEVRPKSKPHKERPEGTPIQPPFGRKTV